MNQPSSVREDPQSVSGVLTADSDLATTAKSKRQKIRHLGIHKPKGRPMAGSKASGLKRRMDGTVVRRNPHGDAQS